jgi:hypothetical protein
MRWYARLRPTAVALVGLLLCACGALPGSAPAAAPTSPPPPPPSSSSPSPAASPSPSPAAAASPTAGSAAAPQATNTSAPAAPAGPTVYVGNTDGEGVYIRNTPVMDDRNQAYPDGTALTIIGPDVEGDGQSWKHVKAPDGTEGYVPAMYTTTTPS